MRIQHDVVVFSSARFGCVHCSRADVDACGVVVHNRNAGGDGCAQRRAHRSAQREAERLVVFVLSVVGDGYAGRDLNLARGKGDGLAHRDIVGGRRGRVVAARQQDRHRGIRIGGIQRQCDRGCAVCFAYIEGGGAERDSGDG